MTYSIVLVLDSDESAENSPICKRSTSNRCLLLLLLIVVGASEGRDWPQRSELFIPHSVLYTAKLLKKAQLHSRVLSLRHEYMYACSESHFIDHIWLVG